MFFPEEPRFLTDEVNRYHLVYTSPDKWTSSSPCEQTFQHRNAIIVLYSIPPGTQFPHIDGYFPKTLDARVTDSTGWIFCRGGNTFVAFRPLQPWQWIEEPADWRWRSAARVNGVVVEVGSTAEFPSFEAFMTAMRGTRLTSSTAGGGISVDFLTTAGDRMQFSYAGQRILNGTPVAFSKRTLYQSPFVNSEYGSGIITLTYKNQKLVLDFPSATIREQ